MTDNPTRRDFLGAAGSFAAMLLAGEGNNAVAATPPRIQLSTMRTVGMARDKGGNITFAENTSKVVIKPIENNKAVFLILQKGDPKIYRVEVDLPITGLESENKEGTWVTGQYHLGISEKIKIGKNCNIGVSRDDPTKYNVILPEQGAKITFRYAQTTIPPFTDKIADKNLTPDGLRMDATFLGKI